MTSEQIQETLAAALRVSTPILLAAQGELLLECAGVLNIGLEGVLLCGAFGGFYAAWASGNVWVGLPCALLSGVFAGAMLGVLTLRVKADQIVSGLALNLAALGLTGLLYQAVKVSAGRPLSAPAFEPVFGQCGLTYFALLLAPVLWWYLYRTARGLEWRAVGEFPDAATSAGIAVATCRWKAWLLAGALGGLGGGFLTLFQTSHFAFDCVNGRGFIALAAVVLGRHHPLGVTAACLFFGLAFAVRDRLQATGSTLPTEWLEALPYLATLLALVLARTRRGSAPAALGKA